MNEIVETEGGAMAAPQDMMEMLAKEAKAAAAKERPAISRISLKSGVMSYQGNAMPNNTMEAVVLAAAYRNVFYEGRYDPNNIVSPSCFALSLEDDAMAPHENVTEKPHPTCSGCPHNEWGSDPNGGRGKACKQTRRLVLLPVTAVEAGPTAIKTSELAVMDLPVTSVKNYSQYINALAASANVPGYAAVAQIKTVPDAKTQFKVLFQPMRVLPSAEHIIATRVRIEQAEALAMQPYEETNVPVDGNDQVIAGAEKKAAAPKKQTKF